MPEYTRDSFMDALLWRGVNPLQDCYQRCPWGDRLIILECTLDCDKKYKISEHHSQESVPIATSDILKNIGDNFYDLADSVSVL